MALNPEHIKWQAPTEEVDGSPIDYDLDYILGVSQVPDDPDMPEVASFPGSLNPEGYYQQAVSEISAFSEGQNYYRLKSSRKDIPEVKSVWSNEAEIVISGVPKAPFLLA